MPRALAASVEVIARVLSLAGVVVVAAVGASGCGGDGPRVVTPGSSEVGFLRPHRHDRGPGAGDRGIMTVATGTLVRPRLPVGFGRGLGAALAAVLVTASIGQAVRVVDQQGGAAPAKVPAATAAVTESLGGMPMAWAANTGQTDPVVRYVAQGMGYATFLTDTEAVVRLDGAVVRLGFEGAAPSPRLSTEEPLAATVSSFAGADPSKWQQGAATAEVVRYQEAWPGIDMTMRGTGSRLEWDLHVAAGADPAVAGLTVTGADRIEIDGDRATLVVGDSELPLAIPAVWQTRPDGTRIEREPRPGTSTATPSASIPRAWDPDLPGVIDPTLEWSTYLGGGLGGSGEDWGRGIAVDGDGNAYVTGSTSSAQFPTTTGALDPSYDCCDPLAFLVKLDPDGSLVYGTYLAGTGYSSDLRDERVVVDELGNAYLTGKATSVEFPTTPGAYDTTLSGSWDVFVTKLDPSGSSLLFSTLIGGSTTDNVGDLAVDPSGAATVTGTTFNATVDYPVTPGAYDTTISSSAADLFVTRLAPSGSSLIYSTYLGGTSTESSGGVAVDDLGVAYVVGTTASGTTFPTTPGAFDTTFNGGGTGFGTGDAFVTRFDPDGAALGYSTFIGGSTADYARDVAIDAVGQRVHHRPDRCSRLPDHRRCDRHHPQWRLGRLSHQARPRRRRPGVQHVPRRVGHRPREQRRGRCRRQRRRRRRDPGRHGRLPHDAGCVRHHAER